MHYMTILSNILSICVRHILRYIAHAILMKRENVCDIADPIILQSDDKIEILPNPNT